MPPDVAEDAVRRFADALIWNWLIGGTDAHAKNYSLLLAGNQIRLAPLYDIASALPYGTHERKLRFAMKLGGDYRRVSAAQRVARGCSRPRARRRRSIDSCARAGRAWRPKRSPTRAKSPEVAALERELPGQAAGPRHRSRGSVREARRGHSRPRA